MGSGWLLLGMMGVLLAAAMAAEEGLYQPRDPCPQVERIVKDFVDNEFKKNPKTPITAGFLRVFFHDCFTGGCDASIFLDREWRGGVNAGSVQERVRELVNEIRKKVNEECKENTVSCADILALATRDAVVAAKGPRVEIPRGRFDSLQAGNMNDLPFPGQSIDFLLGLFARFNLTDPADLVALSGGHTVGKTARACGAVRPKFQGNCPQNLDVITPDVFDNKYFVALTNGDGVFNSDQTLLDHSRTQKFVRDFARDQNAFFRQWAISMTKLSRTNWLSARNGEIRRDCTKPNRARLSSIIDEAVSLL